MAEHKRFNVRHENDISVVKLLDKEISDLNNLSKLNSELTEFITTEKPQRMLLNLGNIVFITSGTIEFLFRRNKAYRPTAAVNPSSKVFAASTDKFASCQTGDRTRIVKSCADEDVIPTFNTGFALVLRCRCCHRFDTSSVAK